MDTAGEPPRFSIIGEIQQRIGIGVESPPALRIPLVAENRIARIRDANDTGGHPAVLEDHSGLYSLPTAGSAGDAPESITEWFGADLP